MNKLISYVGFAIKSNSIIKGLDDLLKSRKPVGLVLISKNLKQNSREKLDAIALSKRIEVRVLPDEVFESLNLMGIKVLGITDKNLASAIINTIKAI